MAAMTVRTFYQGEIEYLNISVESNVNLDQTVQITFDRKTWYDAEWVGDVGPKRGVRFLLDLSGDPTSIRLSQGMHTVFVRFYDTPELPYILAGQIKVA